MRKSQEPKEIICLECKKKRLVQVNGMLPKSYSKKNPRCHSCAAKHAEDKIRKGWWTTERSKGNIYSVGRIPWNKDVKGIHLSPETEFKKNQTTGDKNYKWKGDKVGYFALHEWVKRTLGKPLFCDKCGTSNNVQWANKSHEYKRSETDWIPLCISHHKLYDGTTKLQEKDVIEIRNNYSSGSKQLEISKKYNVSRSLISSIVRRKIWLHV